MLIAGLPEIFRILGQAHGFVGYIGVGQVCISPSGRGIITHAAAVHVAAEVLALRNELPGLENDGRQVRIIDLMQESLQRNLKELLAHKRYDPIVLFKIRDFRTLVNLSYMVLLSKRLGISTELEPVLSFPLGANAISIAEAALAYQTIMTGQTYRLGPDAGSGMIPLITKIVDAKGIVVAEMAESHSIPADSEYEFVQRTEISNPHLWSLDDPYLYKAYSIVEDDGGVVDTYETTFGIRTFHFDSDKGFFLNGEHVKLRGFNAHHGFAGLGTAPPDRIHWNVMMAMKKAGFNFYRSSHNPATPERLDVCDRIGMLVWDEFERKLESLEVELNLARETITRDRNHPSIILWSLENESPLEGTIYGKSS